MLAALAALANVVPPTVRVVLTLSGLMERPIRPKSAIQRAERNGREVKNEMLATLRDRKIKTSTAPPCTYESDAFFR
jgi:hypothetical protein